MISEAFHNDIPNGFEHVDQERLSQWNPNVVNNEKTALKVCNLEIHD